MSGARECELKLRIARQSDFLDLRDGPRWGGRAAPERQVNHYFDTLDLELARQRVLLRIRDRDGERCVLTLKCGREVAPGSFDSLELEGEVPSSVLRAALQDPMSILDLRLPAIDELVRRLGRPQLVLAGTLLNERVRRWIGGWTLEVDRVTFPDGSESYELEVESEDQGRLRRWVDEELMAKGLALEPQRRTKFEQLLDWLAARRAAPGEERHPCES